MVAITFLEAWRRRDSIRFVDGSILPWLLTTATYSARNLARGARRYQAALRRLPPGDATSADHADWVGDDAATQALRGLSLTDQQVLTLCVIEELPIAEAARSLGVREGTVKSRLSRAKVRLRGRLESDGQPPYLEGVTDD